MTASPPLADHEYPRWAPDLGPSVGSCGELVVGPAEEDVLRETGLGSEDRCSPTDVNA